MSTLQFVMDWRRMVLDSQRIVRGLLDAGVLLKHREAIPPNVSLLVETPDEARQKLDSAGEELDDWAIVALWSVFERALVLV